MYHCSVQYINPSCHIYRNKLYKILVSGVTNVIYQYFGLQLFCFLNTSHFTTSYKDTVIAGEQRIRGYEVR